jgi:Cof subfamily protein (haloacid dehalogenase superfamily)
VTAAAQQIRLVVSDIDGTLVTSDKRLTDGVIRAAGLLAEAGVALSLVSSRPPAGFAMMREPLKIASAFGAFNGGALLQPDLSIIEEILVPAEAARIAIATFAELGIDTWLFTNDVWVVSNLHGAYVPKERHTIQAEPVVAPSFDPYLDKVGKLVGSTKDPDLLARCETELQRRLGNLASARRSQPYYLDVTPQIATKGYAVGRIASFLDIPLIQVAVIGDAANDMPMFAVAGMTIAMGNAIDDLKRMANFTTESNENDGFAVAMERYVLPRAKRI